jgi:pimeloyl-ACP methyl ester carboxylesterase
VDDAGHGRGLPVVFLHSAAGDGSHFAAQLLHLRRTRRALAVDLRGHGRSPRVASFDVETAAADVADVLASRGVDRFVVVGHSWGGAVAVALAGARPEQVAGLLLLDPACDGRRIPKEVADGLMRSLVGDYEAVVGAYWASMLEGARPEVRERLLREVGAASREIVIGTLASLLTFDPVTPLSRYRGPKLSVITQLNDRPDAYHRIVDGLPVARVAGTGHWLQLDEPDEVNRILDAFLASVAR